MESIHRRVVNCNSYAKVPSSIQRTAIQQSHLILNGRFSSFPPILTVDWSTATVMQRTVTSIQHTAIQQSQIFLNGEGLFNNSMVDFTDLCQIPGNDSMSAFRSFVSSRISKLPNFPRDSVSVIVSRFASLNSDFVLCRYQFSQILLLEVWLHLRVSCKESK